MIESQEARTLMEGRTEAMSDGRWPGRETWTFQVLFALLLMASILPFWTVRYPVIPDYPNHLASWFVLHHLHDANFAFAQYYASAWGPYPYVLTEAMGVGLQYLLPIDVVGRVMFSLGAMLLPLASWFFLHRASPGNEYLSLFAFVMTFNPMFLLGSLGFQWSIALCLMVVGLWVSFDRAPGAMTFIALILTMTLLFLTHLIGFEVAGLAMGVYTLLSGRRWRRLVALGAVALPGMALLLYDRKLTAPTVPSVYRDLWGKARNLVFPLRIYSRIEDALLLAGLAALVAILFLRRKDIGWKRNWFYVCGALLLAYFVTPAQYGLGAYVDLRIIPILYCFLLATFEWKSGRKVLLAFAVVMALFRIGTVETLFVSKQQELKTLSEPFASIPPRATVLPVVVLVKPAVGTNVGRGEIWHWGYGVIEKGWRVPSLFHIPGAMPLKIASPLYCPTPLCVVRSAQETDWDQVAALYDYVWVDRFPEVDAALATRAERVYSNELVHVYKIRRAPHLP
jgi:hypothetical protein